MRVLAMASQKGGSGKTTLSGHLAVQAQLSGAGPVCLIDIDPQGSLADWWNEREADMPAFAQTTVARLARDLEVLRQQGFRLAVIDTPPAITMAIQSVIAVAELIVIPTRPSPHDLRAVGATVDLCDRAGKPLIFVVNAATPKAKITYEAAVALSQHGTVAPVTLHHRTDFAASMIDGRTVMEIDPNGRSAKEVTELWEYISDRLEKNFRRTVFAAPGCGAGRRRRPVRVRSAASAAASSASKGARRWPPKPSLSLLSLPVFSPARARPARPCVRRVSARSAAASRTSAGTTWASSRPSRPKRRAMKTHDAFGDDVVEHPRVHPTGLDAGSARRSTTSRPRSPTACGDADDDARTRKRSTRPPSSIEPEAEAERTRRRRSRAPSCRVGSCRRLPRRRSGTAPRAAAALGSGKQGQGGVHAAPRSGPPSQAAARLRGRTAARRSSS